MLARNWRDAGKMKITPEMVEAGVDQLMGREDDAWEDVCQDVFEAMLLAAQTPLSTLRCPPESLEVFREARRVRANQRERLQAPSFVSVSLPFRERFARSQTS